MRDKEKKRLYQSCRPVVTDIGNFEQLLHGKDDYNDSLTVVLKLMVMMRK